MLQKMSGAIIRKFESFGLVNNENRDIYLFGVQQFLMLVINVISMIFIGILFRQIIQCLFYMALFILLRSYSGGYHACSSRRCYVYSMLCITMTMVIIKIDLLDTVTLSCITAICGAIIFKLAPVEDCNFLKSITVDNNNKFYYSEDGVLFNKEKTKLIQYPVGNNRGEYIIPNGVETISGNAFKGCTSLKNVSIPEGVESIGIFAFWNCENMDNIEIPKSVKRIDDYAFYSCGSLSSVTLKKESPENYANNIFWASDSNLKIYVPNESIAFYEQWIKTSTVSFYPITEK